MSKGWDIGPFSDITDILYDAALHVDPKSHGRRKYGSIFDIWLETVHLGLIRKDAFNAFAVVNDCALHKDEHDDNKLQPIGVGTGARRFAESFVAYFYQADIAKILLPKNYCVVV